MDKHYDHPRTTAQDLAIFNANPKYDRMISRNIQDGLPANNYSVENIETPKSQSQYRQVFTQRNGGKRRKRTTQRRRKRKGGKSKRRRRM